MYTGMHVGVAMHEVTYTYVVHLMQVMHNSNSPLQGLSRKSYVIMHHCCNDIVLCDPNIKHFCTVRTSIHGKYEWYIHNSYTYIHTYMLADGVLF